MDDSRKAKTIMLTPGSGKSMVPLAIMKHLAAGGKMPEVVFQDDQGPVAPMSPVASRDYEC